MSRPRSEEERAAIDCAVSIARVKNIAEYPRTTGNLDGCIE